MRKALFFEDDLDFCDFIRLCGPETKPAVAGDVFELCRVLHPERPGESALVLFNCKPLLRRSLRRMVRPIDAEVDLAEKTVLWDREESPSSPLTARSRSRSLLEFVELQPWPRNRPPQPAGPILFWISGSEDQQGSLLARLIRDSFRLGNDRIQFGRLESDAGSATVLKIESPSFFLVQACLEDHPESVALYYPVGENRFVRWGYRHPLETWWDRAQPDASGRWLFFRSKADYLHVDPVPWRDAYQLADLTLDFPHRESRAISSGTPPRFEVPLTLERTLSAAEPELWLLDESGLRQLEDTLQVTDQESLRAWQIAVLRIENDESERDWIFIRESHAGKKTRRLHHDFAGLGFVRYQGLNNLYLPVGYELQPPLRRDAYRVLFELEPDTLTIVAPEESDRGYRILRVKDRAFDTLGSLVDYLVERDAAELRNLMSRSLFDFGEYLKAPRHPGLAPEAGDSVAKIDAAENATDIGAETGRTAGEEDGKPESNALTDRLRQPGFEADESLLGEIQREELRLEREIVGAGQEIERWSALLTVKERLGKPTDALHCAIEALWLVDEHSSEFEALTASLARLTSVEYPTSEAAAAVTPDEPEWQRRTAALALAGARPDEPEALDRWIGETTAFLRTHDEGLRAKERWLAWGSVLSANRDVRRETQLREDIRTRITERGLSLEETPPFIRSRIFLDRNQPDAGSESGTNAAAARANIETLRNAGMAFDSPRLRRALRAVLARACSDLNDLAPAEELAEMRRMETDPCLSAWETGLLIMALQRVDPARAQSLEDEYTQRLEQTETETARAIGELRDFYDAREKADSPAAFLARENRGRTYPRGAATETGLLYELSMELERQTLAGNELGAVQVMRSMMNIGDTAEYDDAVKLPQFIETLVAGLERFKWGERGAGLVPVFESFGDRAPGFLSNGATGFYGAILRSNLALGLLTVENLERAAGHLHRAIEIAGAITIELDFIDSAAAIVRTIEQLPLNHRAPFFEPLIGNFRALFDAEHSPYVGNDRLFAVLVKFLNQAGEAASSKDRLSLEQFRHYQLQDEFLILQRIQAESFCENDSKVLSS